MVGMSWLLHLESSGQTPGRRFIFSLDAAGTQRRQNHRSNSVDESKIDLAAFWSEWAARLASIVAADIPNDKFELYTPVSFSPGYHFQIQDQAGKVRRYSIWGSISQGADLIDQTSKLPDVYFELYKFMVGEPVANLKSLSVPTPKPVVPN